ncbi:ribonuclease [Trinickia caryophylli]|uniref:Ribonuclease T1 n=1 Tax=Trinickia caryophylli TaxID=28094 RepID=A0A1X7CBJ2_TRICW|nr:ribonuclease [Trinickia caryophylli]PMS12429.1 ribonuclease [Trinickia caryophylli]TRX19627.1 ribonuclease [Trinickia caryophylli]GLU30796.1 ribonuclease [Trinickia caryophylli]SME93046.1 ribonuclease T1 [Trinickia caryophylli]
MSAQQGATRGTAQARARWWKAGALAFTVFFGNVGPLALPFAAQQAGVASAREPGAPVFGAQAPGTVARSRLPREARDTLNLIASGGPYPYAKDGTVFGNFEKRLPPRERGYYHEYTVPTQRARNRGARRIVCGGPPQRADNCYYTGDHYNSFKRIVE